MCTTHGIWIEHLSLWWYMNEKGWIYFRKGTLYTSWFLHHGVCFVDTANELYSTLHTTSNTRAYHFYFSVMFTFIPMNDVCFCGILSRLLAKLVQSSLACYTVLKSNNRHLSPCHTITDWGNGWVTDAWSSGTHLSMPVLSVTCAVMSVDVQHYHRWVLCMFKIANR